MNFCYIIAGALLTWNVYVKKNVEHATYIRESNIYMI